MAKMTRSGTAPSTAMSDRPAADMILSRALVVSVLLHAAVVGAFTWAGASRSAAAVSPPASAALRFGAAAGDTFDVDAITEAPRRGDRQRTATAPSPPRPSPPERAARPVKPAPAERAPGALRAKRAKPASTQPAAAAGGGEQAPGASEQSDDGRSYGAAGLPPGVRQLAPAFTQAIAAATNRDPFWAAQPLGDVGSVLVVIDVNEDGRITLVENDEQRTLPPALDRLVQRTLMLLRSGRFALSRRGANAGRESFTIDVTLSQVPPPEGDWDDPGHTASIGFSPPAPGKPGNAYFVHGSGRRFDARVTIASSRR
jgi:hypothetical protein